MAIMSSSISKILFLKGSKSDVWVLEKYSWFNILVFTALSIASILLFTTRIVLVEATSSLLCLFALYIFYQRRVLNQLGTFRQLHNQMREKINDFMLENNKLIRTIDQMEISILGIQDVERGLQQVCKTDQVDTFVQCVKETKILNDNIKVLYFYKNRNTYFIILVIFFVHSVSFWVPPSSILYPIYIYVYLGKYQYSNHTRYINIDSSY